MKSLLLLRHAKSSWKEVGTPDHDRPLNKRGKHDAPRVGQLIKTEDLVPDAIISSTAKRAAETALRVAEQAGFSGEIVHEPSLYLASPRAYLEQLALLPSQVRRVMLVGHNPGIAELLYLLTDCDQPFPTAALAHIQWDAADWTEVVERCREGSLRGYWIPKELD